MAQESVTESFAQGVSILMETGVGCVVFVHKTTEGWEALLNGMMTAGRVIVASWPVATEMSHRFNAREVAALATSVHLVWRPRPDDAPVGDWADVPRELPKRVGDWMERLQSEGIRGVDLVFACIGPALEQILGTSEAKARNGTAGAIKEDCPTDTVCFHCQQCAEKYLKARGRRIRSTPEGRSYWEMDGVRSTC